MATRSFRHPGAGEMNRQIVLQSRTTAPTGAADTSHIYTTVATVWAKVRALQGGRIIEGVQTVEAATHLFLIRYRSDQDSWRWILYRQRIFEIKTVRDPDESQRTLEIMAEEVRNA